MAVEINGAIGKWLSPPTLPLCSCSLPLPIHRLPAGSEELTEAAVSIHSKLFLSRCFRRANLNVTSCMMTSQGTLLKYEMKHETDDQQPLAVPNPLNIPMNRPHNMNYQGFMDHLDCSSDQHRAVKRNHRHFLNCHSACSSSRMSPIYFLMVCLPAPASWALHPLECSCHQSVFGSDLQEAGGTHITYRDSTIFSSIKTPLFHPAPPSVRGGRH